MGPGTRLGQGNFMAEESSAGADTVVSPPYLVLTVGPLSGGIGSFHLPGPADPAPAPPSHSSSEGWQLLSDERPEALKRKSRQGRPVWGGDGTVGPMK